MNWIMLDEDDFSTLVSGGVLTEGDVQMILADKGSSRMLDIIRDALQSQDLRSQNP